MTLSLHIGVGLGSLALFLVGGAYGRWECVVEGEVIAQVGGAEGCAEPGEVVLSAEAWQMVKQLHGQGEDRPGGFVKLLRLPPRAPMALQLLRAPTLPPLSTAMVPTLALFLPGAVKEGLLAAVNSKRDESVDSHKLWMSELRRVTTLFINVKLPASLSADEAKPQVETRQSSGMFTDVESEVPQQMRACRSGAGPCPRCTLRDRI